MYFVLYDRFLKSIGEPYICEHWSRLQRAIDFDTSRVTGEKIPYTADPFFVVVNDQQGKMLFSGLASTPVIDEDTNKTVITLKDYRTLFNSDIVVDWSTYSGNTLAEYIQFVFQQWKSQIDVGFSGSITVDVSEISGISWDDNLLLGFDKESVSANVLLEDAMSYYGLYYLCNLDIPHKTLKFVFYKAGINHAKVYLQDFGIPPSQKSFGDFNRVTIYDSSYQKQQSWALTESNRVVKLPSTEALVYPAKNRNYIAEKPDEELTESQALWNAVYDAVMKLSQNRYQEEIEIDMHQYASVTGITELDFSHTVDVYNLSLLYRSLPLGEIETDSSGSHIIRLGYQVQELTQEI